MFGRATIRLGIGPHSSLAYFYFVSNISYFRILLYLYNDNDGILPVSELLAGSPGGPLAPCWPSAPDGPGGPGGPGGPRAPRGPAGP